MNILFFTHYTGLYGANRSLLNLIEGLSARVHPIVIIPAYGPIADELKKSKIKYVIIPFKMSTQEVPHEKGLINNLLTYQYVKRQAILRLYHNILSCFKAIRVIKQNKIDILYSNSSVISIGWWLKMLTGKKYVLHIRELREAHYNFKPDWGKTLFNLHLNNTDLTLVVSNSVKKYYNLKKAYVHYNGIITKKQILYFEKLKPSINKTYSFGIIGYIHPNKGQKDLVQAFSHIINRGYNAKLYVAGSGDYTEIEKIIQLNNLQNKVVILGKIDDPYSFYQKIDTTVVCSKYEAMGRVTIESMISKTPVIGLNHSGTAELITHNTNGLVFEDSQDSLTTTMIKIMTMDNDSRNVMIENAFEFASTNFTIESYSDNIYNLLKDI